MTESKDAADVTETPAGLDVAVTMPGTIVGSHDLQGTDGTERTDRPGEILGTPVVDDATAQHLKTGRELETARADYVTAEVDRANREDLPKLGGPVNDSWVPGDSTGTPAPVSAVAATAIAPAGRGAIAPAGPAPKTAPAVKAAKPGAPKVSPKIDRG